MSLTNQTTALILAGGRGTRIAALAPNVPKPMVDVAGKPFLEWLLRRLLRENFSQILFSVGYKADVVESWLERRETGGAVFSLCREEEPLGTGGAIAKCLADISTPYTLILNGDTLLLANFAPAVARLDAESLNGIIMARAVDDTGRYGRLRVENGLLKEFEEKKPGQGLINGGVYAFRTAWLKERLPSGVFSFEIDTLPRLLSEGARIGVAATDAPFIDIGTPETLTAASEFVRTHIDSFT